MDDPFFRRFFGGGGGGMPREQVQRSLGSGVIVDASGLIDDQQPRHRGRERGEDRARRQARVRGRDRCSRMRAPTWRCCASRTGARSFTAIDLGNSDELQVGDVVLALGNPFGVGQTVTHGIVSALARTQVGITDYQFFIQTDAAINPGNSGGALVDLAGRLVGINTAIFSRSGGSQGIGFAIPVNMVKVVIASAKSGGTTVKRPWLGAKLQAVTPDIAESLGLKRPAGALVATVTEKSPAARAGLKTGDLIVAIDGQTVDDQNAFDYRFATKPLGGSAQIGVVRGGKESEARDRARDRAGNAARRDRDPRALAVHGREGRQHLAGARRGAAARCVGRRRGGARGRRRLARAEPRLPARRRDRAGERREDRAHARSRPRRQGAPAGCWRITIVRGGQTISVQFGG